MSLRIDDRILTDGTYRNGHDCQSYHPPPYRTRPHHPPPRYLLQYSQFNEFFYQEELRNHIYQYNDFEDDYKDEGMVYGRRRRSANPNPNRRDGISNPNKRGRFSNSIHDKGGYSNPDEFGIPSFDGNLDFE